MKLHSEGRIQTCMREMLGVSRECGWKEMELSEGAGDGSSCFMQ